MNQSLDSQGIGHFLDELASGAPVPGGGTAAALNAATGAALVEMVCNLTIGREKYKEYEAAMTDALGIARDLRAQALHLGDEDSAAYTVVGEAYGLPRSNDEEKALRAGRIQEALKGATDVPLRTVALACRITELCAEVVDCANTNAISDVGVGALCARAALDGASLNVKINLALIKDEVFKSDTIVQLQGYLEGAHRLSDSVVQSVEGSISR